MSGRPFELFSGTRLCLAPLAGYSDAPFRLICSKLGADFTFTEMVSADGIARDSEKSFAITRRLPGEAPVGLQLFGADPEIMARGAWIAASTGPAFIDLNFGCPVKKVIRNNGGVAIMRDLGLMERICRAVAGAIDIPFTAKIRSGWSRAEENYLEAGRVIESAGAAAVTLHPRYRTQGFSGTADWNHIANLRKALSIPVIANGDVKNPGDYFKIVDATGCRIVMIGRVAFGQPWIFREIKERLAGREPEEPGIPERLDLLKRFACMEAEWKGERLAMIELRKFYRWFLKGHAGMKPYRARLSTAAALGEVLGILDELGEETERWKSPA